MRDSAELKTISANQSRVMLAESRDSAAMRVIAVITVLFLPATFTAVSFLTSFPGCGRQLMMEADLVQHHIFQLPGG